MKLQRVLLLLLGVMILILLVLQPGFSEVRREARISFSGSIDHIPKDQNYIIVNEMGVYLSPNVKIMSARGSILNRGYLKRGLRVAVEGLRKPEGIVAEKVTLLATPRPKP